VHVQLQKINGQMECFKRPIAPYIVGLDEREKSAYQNLRIRKDAPPANLETHAVSA
jgi:hypothetical protein